MSERRSLAALALAAAVLAAGGGAAVLRAQHPTDGIEWNIENLRPKGQAVIPIFDGWVLEAGRQLRLVLLGYFNLNLEEVLDIPVGPDNFIEPVRFNGKQPTHFMAVPPPPNLYRRYFCVFAVNVPKTFGKSRVVWTLRVRGRSYSVPGHLGSKNYQMPEISAAAAGRDSFAPSVRFEPDGPEGRGRSGVWATRTAVVGQPLALTISVPATRPDARPGGTPMDDVAVPNQPRRGPNRLWWVMWAKHQGAGGVTFNPQSLDVAPGNTTATTTATFSEPGEYVLRVQAIDDPTEEGSYEYHCCWTNGYVKVTVTK